MTTTTTTSSTGSTAPTAFLTSPTPSYEQPKKSSALRKLLPQKAPSPPSYDDVCGAAYQYLPPTTPAPGAEPAAKPVPVPGYGPTVTPFVESKNRSGVSQTVVRREINWEGWQTFLPGFKRGTAGYSTPRRKSEPHAQPKSKSYSWEAAALARP